jgi:hypothetical protein
VTDTLQPVDPNTRYRLRREERRRRLRRRRAAGLAALLTVGGCAAAAVVLLARGSPASRAAAKAPLGEAPARPKPVTPRELPREIRGVHLTMELANRLGRYTALAREGLNTIELDVKDENGDVAFSSRDVPLAKQIGAARDYYDPRLVAKRVHARGLYLIGRIVSFEDPILSERRPRRAIRRSDGGIWRTSAGLGWTNPYDRRVWKYLVDLGAAAARAGFDEIQFDYVRFPSDGDLSQIRYPGAHPQPMGWTVPLFLRYAAKRLHPLGVRVSADVFGLSATRDLGIGQYPRRIGNVVDTIYPMVYPSHFNPGEYDLPDPDASPGPTVAYALRDFRARLRGRKARIVPWLQDFTLGHAYTLAEIEEQIRSARLEGAHGYMLWNAAGVYTRGAFGVG